jgi:hypothetical protein
MYETEEELRTPEEEYLIYVHQIFGVEWQPPPKD